LYWLKRAQLKFIVLVQVLLLLYLKHWKTIKCADALLVLKVDDYVNRKIDTYLRNIDEPWKTISSFDNA
jgi:hypothetical protein